MTPLLPKGDEVSTDNWMMWVRNATGGASARQIARRVGVSPQAVANWREAPTLNAVIGIAVAYHVPLVEGLLAAGLIGVTDLEGIFSVRYIPTPLLVAELRRRAVRAA